MILRLPVPVLVSFSAWMSKAAILLIRFFSIPWLISYLNPDNYAVFTVFLSLEGWLLLLDLGLGSSLQNFFSEQKARLSDPLPYLVIGKHLILVFFFLFSAVLLLFHESLEKWILGTDQGLLLFPSIFFLISSLGSIAYKVLYADRRGYIPHIFQALSAVLSFFSLLIFGKFYQGEQKLYWCCWIWALYPALFAVVAYVLAFKKHKAKDLWKKKYYLFSLRIYLHSLFSRSRKFWIFSVWGACILLMDYFIMLRTLNSEDIIIYSVISRIFNTSFFLYNATLLAFWPHCCEWVTQKKYFKAFRFLKFNMLLGLFLITATAFALWMLLPYIKVCLMKNAALQISFRTIALFTMYFLIRVFCDAFGILFQSISAMRIFFLFLPFQAVLSGAGQFILSSRLGVDGILIALSLSYLCTVFWILPLAAYRQFGGARKISEA